MNSWYRMIDPRLADPARRLVVNNKGANEVIVDAIDQAERFHTQFLTVDKGRNGATKPYYHPNSYAYYGADPALKTFGKIRWAAREPVGNPVPFTPANIRSARFVRSGEGGQREVEVEKRVRMQFAVWPQDGYGDETVPRTIGRRPRTAYTPGLCDWSMSNESAWPPASKMDWRTDGGSVDASILSSQFGADRTRQTEGGENDGQDEGSVRWPLLDRPAGGRACEHRTRIRGRARRIDHRFRGRRRLCDPT